MAFDSETLAAAAVTAVLGVLSQCAGNEVNRVCSNIMADVQEASYVIELLPPSYAPLLCPSYDLVTLSLSYDIELSPSYDLVTL